MTVRIVGLGTGHGDDRVGFAALEALACGDVPGHCELHACADPATELLALLEGASHAILVDAMVDGGAPGRVLERDPGDLTARHDAPGSHGFGVDDVLALAAALGRLPARVTLLGVSIDPELRPLDGCLSPPVRAALPALVGRVLRAAMPGEQP